MTTTMTTLQRRRRQSMMLSSLVAAAAFVLASTSTITVTTAFVMIAPTPTNTNTIHRGGARRTMPNASSSSRLYDTIVSPFDNEGSGDSDATTTTAATPSKLEGPLDLTWDNVEAVLDEMRPFLIQDGGNVIIQDIDGPVVRLELQVRCSVPIVGYISLLLLLLFCTKEAKDHCYPWIFVVAVFEMRPKWQKQLAPSILFIQYFRPKFDSFLPSYSATF